MTKTTYTAIDAAGTVHTRKSDRVYTHTVVYKGGYEKALADAKQPGWAKQDKKNFAYYVALANGTHEHAQYRPNTNWHASYTAEQIAKFEESSEQAIAERIADAKARIAGFANADEYAAKQHADMIARIEAKKAAGSYDVWRNAGWAGRPDLAATLARKEERNGYDVAIIVAKRGAL